ncbi:MAG: sigma factor [Planctomycetota bacterium]|jgi:DNA-directed RNA polymerase specialized sigma24 family protein
MPDDATDLDAARSGDVEAWGRIAGRYAPMLAAYLGSRIRRPALVERLVVAALVAAWRHLGEAEPGDLPGWLRRHAAGQAMTWARDNPAEGLSEPFPSALLPADEGLARRLLRLDRALDQLDESQLRILELRYRGGCDDATAAEALHVPADRIPGLLADALAALDRVDGSLAGG